MPDHVHMVISIPPKYSVAQVVGYIKGKSAIYIARTFMDRKRNFVGQHFWASGYFVSTVGRNEAAIREYIRHQEHDDQEKRPTQPVEVTRHLQVAPMPPVERPNNQPL